MIVIHHDKHDEHMWRWNPGDDDMQQECNDNLSDTTWYNPLLVSLVAASEHPDVRAVYGIDSTCCMDIALNNKFFEHTFFKVDFRYFLTATPINPCFPVAFPTAPVPPGGNHSPPRLSHGQLVPDRHGGLSLLRWPRQERGRLRGVGAKTTGTRVRYVKFRVNFLDMDRIGLSTTYIIQINRWFKWDMRS